MGAMEISTARKPSQREYLLQMLPAEAIILILERLGFRDLMALRVTCRALSEWLPYATRIQATIHVPNRGGPTINSLACIIASGQYVRHLGVEIAADRHATRAQVEEHFSRLAHLVQACSPTLRALRLRLLQATSFRDYETNLLGPSELERIMDSICSCKQLRMLYISTGLVPGLCCSTGDAVSSFCAQLPQLRTLQWRMASYGPERPNHFTPAFVAQVATQVKPGLQLLQPAAPHASQPGHLEKHSWRLGRVAVLVGWIADCSSLWHLVDNFTFEDRIPLPPSLRYVAVDNEAFELLRPVGDLLHACRNLKELYLTGHQCADAHGPDMASLWPAAQDLRVLVLDVLQDRDHMVVPTAPGDLQTLPNLRILVVRHLCTVGHLLHVRCPDLHTMVLFVASLAHTEFLEIFLLQCHHKLSSLQVLFYNGARQDLQYRQFWCAVRPLHLLNRLQLVMSATQAAPMEEVCRLLTAAHSPSLLCLQGLWEIAIYIEGIVDESEPVHFFTGGAKGLSDSSTNAALILDVVGQLASSGIFPALKKVCLYPCWDVATDRPACGPLPAPASAPHLLCTALEAPGDRTGGAWGNGLRSIVGSRNEEAALRAIESMSASFDVDEIL